MKKISKHLSLLLMTYMLFSFATLEAQTKASLQQFITAYNQTASNYKQADKQKLIAFYDRNYKGEITFYSIKGNANKIKEDFKTLTNSFDRLQRISDTYTFSNLKFLKVMIKGDIGIVSIQESYKASHEGKIAFNGETFNTITAKKTLDSWKIVSQQAVTVEDARYQGLCRCQIFESKKAEYITQTEIPMGIKYASKLNNFKTKQNIDGNLIISVDGQSFMWDKKRGNHVYLLKNNQESQKVKLGTASSVQKAITIIVYKYLYEENCTNY